MDSNQQFPQQPLLNQNTTAGISNQIIIIVLVALLVLSSLGINIFTILGSIINSISAILWPIVAQILSIFGYTTGSVLTKTADVVGDVAKTGVDVAGGSIQSVGNILKDASRGNVAPIAVSNLDQALNVQGSVSANEPVPSSSSSPIQKPSSSNNAVWCLVGEYEGKRGCIAVGEQDKCMSGQIFSTQNACLNPGAFAGK